MALLPILVVAAGAFAFNHFSHNPEAVQALGERLGALKASAVEALPGVAGVRSGSEPDLSEPGLASILAVLETMEPEEIDEWRDWEKPRLIRETVNPVSQNATHLYQTGPRGPRTMPDWVAAPTMRETTIGPGGGVINVYYQDTRI